MFFFSPEIRASEQRAWWERTADVPGCAYAWRLKLIAGLDLRPRLREVQAPALVLSAPDDRVETRPFVVYLASDEEGPFRRWVRGLMDHYKADSESEALIRLAQEKFEEVYGA